MVIMGQFFQNI